MNGFILHLQGPMLSCGDTGFGQIRDAGAFPSRSVVLGIIAAALGVERGGERLLELHRTMRVHIATVLSGTLSLDYHTVKPAGYEENPAGLFRRSPPGVNSVQTYRSYHDDAHFVAFVEGSIPELIEECRQALRQPVYTAFLGRRSCVPAIPLLPQDITGDSCMDILATAASNGLKLHSHSGRLRSRNADRARAMAYLDGDYTDAMPALLLGSRRDLLVELPRSYVNRPVTHVALALQDTERSQSTMTNEDFFDAAS